jgi:hypothetical protein
MRNFYRKIGILVILFWAKLFFAQAFTENFDNITTLTGSGWFQQNNSSPLGSNPVWFQGNPPSAGGPFVSYNGADNAYIACNFNSTAGTGTISNWLVAPNRTYRNGDVIKFYTRKYDVGTDYPDRMEIRFSANGASTNVGTGATSVGDFTTLLLSINPTLVAGGYPRQWAQYTITISGLPAPTSGRFAFRYYVTSAGPTGTNSDYIGLDNVVYTTYVCPTFTMTTGGALTGGVAGSAYSSSLSQTGALGAPNFAVTAGALPPGLTLSASGTISGTPTATGTFNFTVTVNDASGCSGSQSYSITVVCPPNPITIADFPTLCSNSGLYTLEGALPAGGTYSGTGVSGGQFDPAAGTQTITYSYTNPYGCTYSLTKTITVNTAPTVSLATFAPICSNSGLLTLTGGLPAGGTYSGTGVSGGQFNPASGTQTVTYTYTDANGCSSSASRIITVNTTPTVSLATFAPICSNSGLLTLTGGLPAGGTYSGTGVSGGQFNPASGTQTVTYTYTDANGCSSSASRIITVNTAPTVSLATFAPICSNSGLLTLTGGLPAGGTYSGTGVSGGQFNPASGTQTVTYTYTDANGCSSSASRIITVNTAPTVTLATFAPICSNSGLLTLTGGLPAGGTYSGTGVSGGQFNPVSGTQTITYTYTDANGCSSSASRIITVNTAPTVSLATFAPICSNSGLLTLTGGLPAGGTYSGTGVSGGQFNPASGTQTVTYTYTDANGCSSSASRIITVNTAPTVTLATFAPICSNSGLLTLTGGLPAGGTYSGTGVSGGQFNPASGTQTVIYTYTDANGCSASDSKTITVNTAPEITTQPSNSVICAGAGTTFSAAASNGTGYQWQMNTGSGFSNINNDTTYSGATTSILTITGASASLNGNLYRVLVTGQASCASAESNSATLTVSSVSGSTSQTNVSCNGASNGTITLTPSGGVSPYTFDWSDGADTQNRTGLAAGTYSVTIKDANGCVGNTSVTIIQPDALVATAGAQTNVACNGSATGSATVNVTGGTGTYTYSWNTTPEQTGMTATGLAAGTYVVTVKDANQCQTSQSFTITEADAVVAPTGAATQTFNAGDTLSVLVANGQNIKWYANASDATNHINDLPMSTLIVNNTTYYATQTVGGCESKTSLAVLAWNEDMGVINTDGKTKIRIYPNPVKEVLHFDGQEKINKIVIVSIDGKKVSEKTMNGERKLNVHTLVQGTYLINIFTDKGVQTIKFIKN